MSDEPPGGCRRRGYDDYSSEDDEPHNTTSPCRGRQMPTSSPSQLQPSAKCPQPAPRRTISSDQKPYDTRMQSPRFINNDSQEDSRDHGSIKQGDLLCQPEISPRYDRDIKSGINNSQDIGDERVQKYHEDIPKKLENRHPQKNERNQEDIDEDSRRYAPNKEYGNENAPRRRFGSPHHTVQDSDDDGHDSRRYAPGKGYENAPRKRVKSPHYIDQDLDHEGYDSRRYAPSIQYDNENAPRRRAKSPHHMDQESDHDGYDSTTYATIKEYDNENAPKRRVKSPHHTDQDSDHNGHNSTRYAPGKEYDNENAPRRRVKSPYHTDQDSDHDDHNSTRYAPGKEYDNEIAPRRRVKSPHQPDQDSRRYAPGKECDPENAPRRMRSPNHTYQDSDLVGQDSRKYVPAKEYDNENAPRRRARSPHHTDQDSDHDGYDSTRYTPGKEYDKENAPRRRARSPHHTDQDSDQIGHDSRKYAPGKGYDNENAPRRRAKSPHHTDQDSEHDDHDSTRYAPCKEYDKENAPRRIARSPHHTDQDSDQIGHDSRKFAPGKKYDNENAPRRIAKNPYPTNQDSDHEGHDSRRYAPGKEYDNENAPRRRAKSPYHTDQDSNHEGHDSRRYVTSKEYDNENVPRGRARSPHHVDQDSEHDCCESIRYDPSKKYDYENSPRKIVKSPHHTDHDGLDSRSKEYYNENAPKGRVKGSPHTDQDSDHGGRDSKRYAPRESVKSLRPTDDDGRDFRKYASSKDYEYDQRKGIRSLHHTDNYPDDDGHDSRRYAPRIDVPEKRLKSHQWNDMQDPEHYLQRSQNERGVYQRRQIDQQHYDGNAPQKGGYRIDHGMNISSVPARTPSLHHRSPSDRRCDNEKDNYLQHNDCGRRNEYRNDNTRGGPDGMPATRRRDNHGMEDLQRSFERMTTDEKTQSKGFRHHSMGGYNYPEHAQFQNPDRSLPSGDVRNDPYTYHSNKSPMRQEKPMFSARSLVIILLKCSKYEASILQLVERCGLQSSDIRNVVVSNQNLFEMKQEIVCLRPKVKICDAHVSSHGCLNKSSCIYLHICPKFVMSVCNDNRCTLGHKLDSGHNTNVLKPFLISSIPESQFLEILKLSIPPTKSSFKLNVCYDYSSGKCQRHVCGYLHICNDFLMNNCLDRSCKLSHNLLSKENCRVLKNHGIDTNESPRDVYKILKDTHPSLFTPQKSDASNRNYSADQHGKYSGGSTGNYRSRDDITPPNSRPAGPADRQNISNPNRGNSPQRGNFYSSGETSNSVWSFHYEGNTEIAEICFYSVTSRCRYEDTGCKRLHAKQHFHWQVKERGRGWVNLRKNQVDSLENAFCDPDKDDVKIPSIDPNNCPKGLLKLFGQDRWQADFKSMSLDNPKTNVTLTLRRLCSEDVDGSVKASRNQWYFLDQNNVWIQYGNTDTTKRDFLASNITSNDIERHFIKTPSVPLTFKNSIFLYVLDFGQMMQTNTQTHVSRKVKRRPVPHMQHNQQKPGFIGKLMSSWTNAP